MRIREFNPWLPHALGQARRLIEDSDRKHLVDVKFMKLISEVHRIATATAIRTPGPKLERYQVDDGVTLNMEWYDEDSSWHLYFGVRRTLGEKPVVLVDFYGTIQNSYAGKNPDEAAIRKALYDYFEEWMKA